MLEFKVNDQKKYVVEQKGETLLINDSPTDWDWLKINEKQFHIVRENQSYLVDVISVNTEEKKVRLKVNGKEITLSGLDKMDLLLKELGMDSLKTAVVNDLKAPMPGLILDVLVSEGQEVKKGDKVLILEAMKMENVIKAPADVTIKEVKIEKGDNVEKNHTLITFG